MGTVLSAQSNGPLFFETYTEDSNLLNLVVCIIYAACLLRSIVHKGEFQPVPQWAVVLKYVSTACLMVTFVIVVCVLAPMEGPNGYAAMLLSGSMLYFHLLCPVVAFVSFVLLDTDQVLSARCARHAMIPTLVYAFVLISLNATGAVVGPYPFLRVCEQPIYMSIIWAVVILGGAYLLARLLLLIRVWASCRMV